MTDAEKITDLETQVAHWKAEHLKRQQGEDAALQKVQDVTAGHEADKKNALEQQALVLGKQHEQAFAAKDSAYAAEVKDLKQKWLVPAQQDLNNRKRADLDKELAAAMDALK